MARVENCCSARGSTDRPSAARATRPPTQSPAVSAWQRIDAEADRARSGSVSGGGNSHRGGGHAGWHEPARQSGENPGQSPGEHAEDRRRARAATPIALPNGVARVSWRSRVSKTRVIETPAMYGPWTRMAATAEAAPPRVPARARSCSLRSLLVSGAHNSTNAATPANNAKAT